MTIFCFSFPFLTFLDSLSTGQSVHWWAKLNIKGVFGFLISITYNSVFITHNSKIVWDSWLNACLDFVFSFVSITQFSDFWVMSYGNWKHILAFFSFHNFVFNGNFVIKPTTWVPRSEQSHTECYFWQTHQRLLLSLHTKNQPTQKYPTSNLRSPLTHNLSPAPPQPTCAGPSSDQRTWCLENLENTNFF